MLQMKKIIFLCTLFLSLNAESIPSLKTKSTINNFPSVKWIESDVYNLLCRQIYNTAKQNFLKLDLNNYTSTIIERQNINNLPPAIIVDIDETILLNLEFRKETMKKVGTFSYDIWKKHINLKTAIPISGSLDYLQYISKNNVKIIYISNRDIEDEDATFELLSELKYPIKSKEDLLLKNEKKDWTRNKTSRRIYIGKKYKVIQIFGDSLSDFTETHQQAIFHKNNFGKSWFLLPNPIYGSWQ